YDDLIGPHTMLSAIMVRKSANEKRMPLLTLSISETTTNRKASQPIAHNTQAHSIGTENPHGAAAHPIATTVATSCSFCLTSSWVGRILGVKTRERILMCLVIIRHRNANRNNRLLNEGG